MSDKEDKKIVWTAEDIVELERLIDLSIEDKEGFIFDDAAKTAESFIQSFIDSKYDMDLEALEKMSEFIDYYIGKA